MRCVFARVQAEVQNTVYVYKHGAYTLSQGAGREGYDRREGPESHKSKSPGT